MDYGGFPPTTMFLDEMGLIVDFHHQAYDDNMMAMARTMLLESVYVLH